MNDNSDKGDASNDLNWQLISTTRKRQLGSPKLYKNKRKATKQLNDDVPSTSNKFALLRRDDENDEIDDDDHDDDDVSSAKSIAESVPKPPPIYIPDVIDINKMISNIANIIDKHQFSYKCLNNNQIRLMVKTVDSYRTLVKYLEGRSIGFHTYQLKQERSYRVVIKGLHCSTPITDIKAELILLGHQVRNVVNVRSRVTKEPLPMFYIDLDPSPNNKEIFNV